MELYHAYLSTTPKLLMTNDTYEPSDKTGKLMGTGGIRVWDIAYIAKGEQKIETVYSRSWEPVTGNETGFSVTVVE
ncbi:MAG: protease inhibitor I42 family protein [Methanoregula sp.]